MITSRIFTELNSADDKSLSESKDESNVEMTENDDTLYNFLEKTRLAKPILPQCNMNSKHRDLNPLSFFDDVFLSIEEENSEEVSLRLKNEEVFILFLRGLLSQDDTSTLTTKNAHSLSKKLFSIFSKNIMYMLKLCYSSEDNFIF